MNNYHLWHINAQRSTESDQILLAVDCLHVDREKSLQTYYAALDCRAIDIVSATIHGVDVDLIVDDEGLLHQPPEGREMLDGFVFHDDHGNAIPLAGSVLVAAVNEDGETIAPRVDRDGIIRWFTTDRAQVVQLPPLY